MSLRNWRRLARRVRVEQAAARRAIRRMTARLKYRAAVIAAAREQVGA